VLDHIEVFRVGTRHTFPFYARKHYRRHLDGWPNVLVEDINKVPLYTQRWGAPATVALVPHLFGSTVFQELAAPLAAAVWTAERPLGWSYRHVPFEAISESTADDLVHRGIPRASIAVIYPGIDTVGLYTQSGGSLADAGVCLSRAAQEIQRGAPRHPGLRRARAARCATRDRRRR
jgi:hypothetical protein